MEQTCRTGQAQYLLRARISTNSLDSAPYGSGAVAGGAVPTAAAAVVGAAGSDFGAEAPFASAAGGGALRPMDGLCTPHIITAIDCLRKLCVCVTAGFIGVHVTRL